MFDVVKQVLMLGLVAALFAWGCSQPGQDEVTVDDLGDGILQLHPADGERSATEIPDGTPGQKPDAPVILGARDCSYVQWCNEPGPRGTICRARPECGCSGVIECNEEVRRICGGFVDPAYFLCPGQP